MTANEQAMPDGSVDPCDPPAEPGNEGPIPSIFERGFQAGLPIYGQVELTHRCNLNCVHCYLQGTKGTAASVNREMSCEQVLSIMQQAANAGCLFMGFTGGEALLREDFLDIYVAARKLGMFVSVLTNGTLVTEKHAKVFREFPPIMVSVGTYGATDNVYDRTTRTRGNFARFMRGVNLLLDTKLPMRLQSTSILAAHQDVRPLMDVEALSKRLGAYFAVDLEVIPPVGGAESSLEAYDLARDTLIEWEQSDQERREDMAEFIQMRRAEIRPGELFKCRLGRTAFAVDARGMLIPCVLLRDPVCDLRVHPFAEGWGRLKAQYDGMRYTGAYACARCSLFGLCAPCPAKGLAENGSLEVPFSVHCRLFKLRARRYGGEAWSSIDMRSGVPV